MREFVPAGECRVRKGDGELSVLGLGSCVVIVLYDPGSRIGGMAHVLLPDPSFAARPGSPCKFASTAVSGMLVELEVAGADRERVVAHLIGGASMFGELQSKETEPIGTRNVLAARDALSHHGVSVIGEDVGGERGRSVDFDLRDGRVRVTALRDRHVEI